MVVQASLEALIPSVIIPKSNLESNKYVVVKNHVRELRSSKQDKPRIEQENNDKNIEITEQNVPKKTKLKGKLSIYNESSEVNSNNLEISESDLEELRTVYHQCKAVVKKIETKYGHLLNLTSLSKTKGVSSPSDDPEEVCKCNQNKKIVFDEEGQQLVKDPEFDHHICLKKLKCKNSHLSTEIPNIQIEYESEENAELPDSLNDLGNILKEPDINNRLRRNVINKIRSIRQEYINELKFDKQTLVEKLKRNPEEVLKFKGANLSSLSGYPS